MTPYTELSKAAPSVQGEVSQRLALLLPVRTSNEAVLNDNQQCVLCM